jgi:hypothetical protein
MAHYMTYSQQDIFTAIKYDDLDKFNHFFFEQEEHLYETIQGNTFIEYAIILNAKKILERMMKIVNVKRYENVIAASPLILAIYQEKKDMISILLRGGFSPDNIWITTGYTPLRLALDIGNKSILDILYTHMKTCNLYYSDRIIKDLFNKNQHDTFQRVLEVHRKAFYFAKDFQNELGRAIMQEDIKTLELFLTFNLDKNLYLEKQGEEVTKQVGEETSNIWVFLLINKKYQIVDLFMKHKQRIEHDFKSLQKLLIQTNDPVLVEKFYNYQKTMDLADKKNEYICGFLHDLKHIFLTEKPSQVKPKDIRHFQESLHPKQIEDCLFYQLSDKKLVHRLKLETELLKNSTNPKFNLKTLNAYLDAGVNKNAVSCIDGSNLLINLLTTQNYVLIGHLLTRGFDVNCLNTKNQPIVIQVLKTIAEQNIEVTDALLVVFGQCLLKTNPEIRQGFGEEIFFLLFNIYNPKLLEVGLKILPTFKDKYCSLMEGIDNVKGITPETEKQFINTLLSSPNFQIHQDYLDKLGEMHFKVDYKLLKDKKVAQYGYQGQKSLVLDTFNKEEQEIINKFKLRERNFY